MAPDESLRPTFKQSILNGLPVVSCSGFHGHHTETFAQGVSGEMEIGDKGISVFAVVRQREEIWASCLFKYGPDNNKGGIGISMNNFGAWVDPDNGYSVNITGGGALVGQGFQLLCLTADFARGVAEIFRNGQRVGRLEQPRVSKYRPKGSSNSAATGWHIPNCAGSCMSDIAEVIAFKRSLTPDERQQIEMHLQQR